MQRSLLVPACTLLYAAVLTIGGAFPTAARPAAGLTAPADPPLLSDGRGQPVLVGGGSAAAAKNCADTVYVYGGPGSLAGKFQTASLQPDAQGWTGFDATQVLPRWHVSTFNAANLGGTPAYWLGPYNGATPNHAMWVGVETGFRDAPGYGNGWYEMLDRRFTVADGAAATTLNWDFVFNFDMEPGFDFFTVQWDSAGTMVDLDRFSGDNRDANGAFTAPEAFSDALVVPPSAYVGSSNDEVHLRLLFTSDASFSDQDGNYPTDGAVQVDNLQISGDNGVGLSQATFEAGEDGGWAPVPSSDFAGDFFKVIPGLTDLDPCRDNDSPQVCFIDDGTPPNNDPLQRSTGGSTSPTWSYGVPGAWVVNYTGGVTFGSKPLHNEVWSPEIAWDVPGTCDDAIAGGAFLRFTVWAHTPVLNGIFYVWGVRNSLDNGNTWSSWRSRNLAYFSDEARFVDQQLEISDLLVGEPTHVQIALGVIDLADFWGFPGNDATPGPCFDNVALAKYSASGPAIAVRMVDLFQDGFPRSGYAVDCAVADPSLYLLYQIRVDMARDIRPAGTANACPGDSMTLEIVPRKPGAVVDSTNVFLEFVLQTQPNDRFAAARAAALAQLGATPIAADRWRGSVPGQRSYLNNPGSRGRWFFDLPDGTEPLGWYQASENPLFFPGDQIRYFVRASTLNPVETATLPADTTGFSSGVGYSRIFTINGLPTLTFTGPSTCTQPAILVWNEFEHYGGEDELLQAFQQNGLAERVQFDTYTPKSPSSRVSNGLGGVHGATAAHLAGYNCLIYESGDLSGALLSDGSNTNGNDKGNDIGVLTAWMGQPAHRYAAYWGDDLASSLTGGGATFRSNVMGVSLAGGDVRPEIGNQTAPQVAATAAGALLDFATPFVAYGGCVTINDFDHFSPVAGAVKAHEFLNAWGGAGTYAPAASVYFARQDTIGGVAYDRVSVTFPYGLVFVQDAVDGWATGGGRSARANLLRELLLAFGHGAVLDENVVGADPITSLRLTVAQNRPNPFNPRTDVAFTAPARGRVAIRIYNLRGELVTTLLDEVVQAGPRSVTWSGVDGRGCAVASGIYLYQVEGFGRSIVKKMALIK